MNFRKSLRRIPGMAGSGRSDGPPPPYTATADLGHHAEPSMPWVGDKRRAPPKGSGKASEDPIVDEEEQFTFLKKVDTVFVIDDSSSMNIRDCGERESVSRWVEARDALSFIAPVCTKYDKDGVDIYFLNKISRSTGDKGTANGGYYKVKKAESVIQIFKDMSPPFGGTPTAERLDEILGAFERNYKETRHSQDKPKPLNVIIITDGKDNDSLNLEATIVKYARKAEELTKGSKGPWERPYGLQFYQIGNDKGATEALNNLDNNLKRKHGVPDIVDTFPFDKVKGNLTGGRILEALRMKVVAGGTCGELDDHEM